MRKLLIPLILLLLSGVAAQTPEEDVVELQKTVRILIADKQSLTDEKDELKRQVEAQKSIAENWKSLFTAEKERADVVQGDRIEQLRTATIELDKSNALLRQQIQTDKDYIERLERRVEGLKRQRLYVGIAGFAAGTLAGARVNF